MRLLQWELYSRGQKEKVENDAQCPWLRKAGDENKDRMGGMENILRPEKNVVEEPLGEILCVCMYAHEYGCFVFIF